MREGRFNYRKQRRQGKEAEVFAAHLLIPGDKLKEKLREEWVKESPDPIPDLAEEFQVSETL
jgi:Zn-dependent peptidase ImmA (M78 family)